MTIKYHPSDETLVRYAAQTLEAGTRLVVAAHIETCSRCQAEVDRFEAIGGTLLEDMPETALSEGSFARVIAMIDSRDRDAVAVKRAILASPHRPDGIVLPRALDGYHVSPWRWLGPGIHMSRVTLPHAPDANVIMLRVGANRPLPEHGHAGVEYTQVLTGSLVDGSQRMMPGDLVEADAEMQHQPVAGPEGECICLAAVDGKLEIRGFIGRMVASMVGL